MVGDQLYFYFSGREKDPDNWPGRASTGLATLRRDGFASMDAGPDPHTLTTRPVTFKGKHLFVNVDCPEGELKAEVLDEEGNVIPGLSVGDCNAISLDQTLTAVTWKDSNNLSAIAGKPVRFRFLLKNGSLYAFLVSPNPSGASLGYVAAGGPGFRGPTDTIGSLAIEEGQSHE